MMTADEIIKYYIENGESVDDVAGFAIGVPPDPSTWNEAKTGDVYLNIRMREKDAPISLAWFLYGYRDDEIPKRMEEYKEYLKKMR